MNYIKNKSYRNYDYTSRYSTFPYYYHIKDEKYFYGLTGQLNKNKSYTLHQVKDTDTLDSIAFTYYGRPDYFWIIADFNSIQDPFIKLIDHFNELKIPSLGDISYGN